VWEYVERSQCRRAALLAHFGDRSEPHPQVDCCDTCAPGLVPMAPAAPRSAPGASSGDSDLDSAIVEVVRSARPPVGRTRAVEILRGGRSKVVVQYAYDSLPLYGSFAHLRSTDVLGRVDELLESGTLRSSGGKFPKLKAA
jgi:ATP-dependent DNA helicase RecQ